MPNPFYLVDQLIDQPLPLFIIFTRIKFTLHSHKYDFIFYDLFLHDEIPVETTLFN